MWCVYTCTLTSIPISYTPKHFNSFRQVTRKRQKWNVRVGILPTLFFLNTTTKFHQNLTSNGAYWGDHTSRRYRWHVATVDCLVTFMKGRLVSRELKNFGVNNDMKWKKSKPYPLCRQVTGKGVWPWLTRLSVTRVTLRASFHQCSILIHLTPKLHSLTNWQRY